jgi:hypothetical protein
MNFPFSLKKKAEIEGLGLCRVRNHVAVHFFQLPTSYLVADLPDVSAQRRRL